MVAETCKCSEDLKREFYDFAYHGLRAEHNELVHRVQDLESALPEMSEEEIKDFERLHGYQVNRQRQVEGLEKLWRGLFSPVCYTLSVLGRVFRLQYRVTCDNYGLASALKTQSTHIKSYGVARERFEISYRGLRWV